MVAWSSLRRSPRVWTLLSALLTRGVGFVASLSLSREAGADSLALYIALVITAAAVVAPFAQVFFNSATLAAARKGKGAWLQAFVQDNLILALALSVPLSGVFYALHWHAAADLADRVGVSWLWLVCVGLSVVIAPLWQAVLQGTLNGLGAQTPCALVTAMSAGGLLPLSYPAAQVAGVRGAWVVLMLSVWLPVVAMSLLLWQQSAPRREGTQGAESPRWVTLLQFWQGLPNAASLLVAGGLAWWCTVQMPHQVWGAAGVATLALSGQWLNLILLPATTWSAVAMGELAVAHAQAVSRRDVQALQWRWLTRNGVVTLLAGLAVCVAAPWLERMYRLEQGALSMLLMVSAVAAVLMAAYGVIERSLIVWGRQRYLVLIAVLAGAVQVGLNYLWVRDALVGVQWAALVGAALTLLLGAVALKSIWQDVRE